MNPEKIEIEKLLKQGETVQVQTNGNSMYPLLIPNRDWVRIRQTDTEELKRGDVILYRRKDSILVLHRVWKRSGDDFYLLGDNQVEIEGPLEGKQIRGKMVGLIRRGKEISQDSPGYRIYWRLWLFCLPLRKGIRKLRSKKGLETSR